MHPFVSNVTVLVLCRLYLIIFIYTVKYIKNVRSSLYLTQVCCFSVFLFVLLSSFLLGIFFFYTFDLDKRKPSYALNS